MSELWEVSVRGDLRVEISFLGLTLDLSPTLLASPTLRPQLRPLTRGRLRDRPADGGGHH